MGTKLNPDGSKIKALRIQRGWTQEQLAEIAGISSRTVQRAESANCAAFETLRSIAGAFDTDFDRLLQPDVVRSPDPEPQAVIPAQMPDDGLEPEPSVIKQAVLPVRRTWPMLWVAASALTVGLVAGVLFTYRSGSVGIPGSPATRLVSAVQPQISISNEIPKPGQGFRQVERAAEKISNPETTSSIPNLNPKADVIAANPGQAGSGGSEVRISSTADPAAEDVLIQPQLPTTLHLPLKAQDMLLTLAIPEPPVSRGTPAVIPGDSDRDGEDSGVVLQAVDVAAKKTGKFAARIGTSIKSVF